MKVEIYEALMRRQASRRDVLRGTASAAALLGLSGAMGGIPGMAFAADDLRAQILQIPGVGKGSPTDADWQKVGELCLGATKANVTQGEFAGVELTFMGLNNQNLHNFLFRGFLKPWEAYTGAKINWIDLAQADYTPASSSRSQPARSISISLKWARPSKATPPGADFSTRCPTGLQSRSKPTTW